MYGIQLLNNCCTTKQVCRISYERILFRSCATPLSTSRTACNIILLCIRRMVLYEYRQRHSRYFTYQGIRYGLAQTTRGLVILIISYNRGIGLPWNTTMNDGRAPVVQLEQVRQLEHVRTSAPTCRTRKQELYQIALSYRHHIQKPAGAFVTAATTATTTRTAVAVVGWSCIRKVKSTSQSSLIY